MERVFQLDRPLNKEREKEKFPNGMTNGQIRKKEGRREMFSTGDETTGVLRVQRENYRRGCNSDAIKLQQVRVMVSGKKLWK